MRVGARRVQSAATTTPAGRVAAAAVCGDASACSARTMLSRVANIVAAPAAKRSPRARRCPRPIALRREQDAARDDRERPDDERHTQGLVEEDERDRDGDER